MTLYDHPRTSIEHPSRSVPDDVADSLKKFREQDDAELARQQKLAKLARPTKEERRELSEIYESTAKARGLDVEQMRALHDISTRKSHRVHEEVEAYSASIRKELETYIRGERALSFHSLRGGAWIPSLPMPPIFGGQHPPGQPPPAVSVPFLMRLACTSLAWFPNTRGMTCG
jgi:hypothetical protein